MSNQSFRYSKWTTLQIKKQNILIRCIKWLINLYISIGFYTTSRYSLFLFFCQCALNFVDEIFFLCIYILTSNIKPSFVRNIFIFWELLTFYSPVALRLVWFPFLFLLIDIYLKAFPDDRFLFFDEDYFRILYFSSGLNSFT